jgi:small GTP-binding protein
VSQAAEREGGAFQVLTDPGPAAIAVIRVRGPLAGPFLRRHIRTPKQNRAASAPRGRRSARAEVRGSHSPSWAAGRVFRADLLDEDGSSIDDMLLSVHAPAPDWDVRLHLHGSPGLVRCCTDMLTAAGFSEESEAVSTLWTSASLIEAEALAVLPRMLTLRGVQWLSRQSRVLRETIGALAVTRDIEGARERCREIIARRPVFDWFARPLRVALAGPPNTGKSTLANALADQHASLVSPVPGTTRDWVEIPGEIEGFPVLWLDTAGLRKGGDDVEAEGIRRTRDLMKSADIVLLVLDTTVVTGRSWVEQLGGQTELCPACVAVNKVDLIEDQAQHAVRLPMLWPGPAVPISALRRTGLNSLTARLLEFAGYKAAALKAPAAFTDRQVEFLRAAISADRKRFPGHLRRCLGAPRPA